MMSASAKQHGRPPAPDMSWVDLVGGHPILDLVNTVAWRHDPRRTVDRLTDADVLLAWSATAGVLPPKRAAVFRADLVADTSLGSQVLEDSRSVRAMAHRLLRPVAQGARPSSTHLRAVHAAVVAALGQAEIVEVVPLRWTVDLRTAQDLPTALAFSLWQLVQFEDLHRLRECLDAGCGWLFLDRSKNGSRVWCSSADCGNRTRARRHYQRRRATGDRRGAVRSENHGSEVTR